MAQESEFYTLNIVRDWIAVNKNCHPDISTWSDIELVNTKPGWESLGVVSSSLLLRVCYDHVSNAYLIPQTMAGVEIYVDSDEYQA